MSEPTPPASASAYPFGPLGLEAVLGARGLEETLRACARAIHGLTGRPVGLHMLPPGRPPISEVHPLVEGAPAPEDSFALLAAARAALEAGAAPGDESRPGAVPFEFGGLGRAALSWHTPGLSPGFTAAALAGPLGGLLAWKFQRDGALESAEARARHFERWFKTVDAQLRVLDRERQKFLALVNRGDSSFMVLGKDGAVKWVNGEMGRIHEAHGGAQGLIGRRCHEVCGHGTEACPDCPVQRVLAGESIAHQERLFEAGGSPRQLYVTALPIRNPEGAVEEVLVTQQDLTDLEVLRRSEHRLRKLFDRSADAIIMAEPETLRVLLTNSTAQSILGYSEAELVQLTLHDLHPAAELPRIRSHYEFLQSAWGASSQDLEVRTSGGDILICNVGGALFELEGSQLLMVEMRDVTRLRTLERELAHADRLASLGTMSAGIAHEFKNRLAPLRGLAQLLISGKSGDPERVERYAGTLLGEVDRLAALVRDVLDFARPQAARPHVRDLATLTRQVTGEFRTEFEPELGSLGLSVVYEGPGEESVPVSVDAEQLRRVFQNILKNAMEACAERGEIRVSVTVRARKATVRVTDTGCGITPEIRGRIFDPFFTTKGARGTGLGMCIVKSLVESNGGSIAVESAAGGGTAVVMNFDLHEPGLGSERAA